MQSFMEPSKEIKIKIFQNRQEVSITPELKDELETIYKKKLAEKWKEEQRIFEQRLPLDRVVTLREKIRKFLPHESSIPETLIRFIQFEDDYNCLIKFLSLCEKIRRITADWTPGEINFNHELFIKLSEKHLKLSKAINNHAERHDDDSHILIKKIIEQTYMTSHIILLIEDAKNFVKGEGFKFTKELENELRHSLKDMDIYFHFKNYINHCKDALRLKKKHSEASDQYRAIAGKIKHTLFPLFHVYFPKKGDKKNYVIDLAKEFLKIVESPHPRSYLSYIRWN
jgi:hypothetical protein